MAAGDELGTNEPIAARRCAVAFSFISVHPARAGNAIAVSRGEGPCSKMGRAMRKTPGVPGRGGLFDA
jgi:hypothetical protein